MVRNVFLSHLLGLYYPFEFLPFEMFPCSPTHFQVLLKSISLHCLVSFWVTCSICFLHFSRKYYYLYCIFTMSILMFMLPNLFHLFILLPNLNSCSTMELTIYFKNLFHIFINLLLARPCQLLMFLRRMNIAH